MSLIKHSAFAQEREVRLVRIMTGDFTEPRHRVSSLGIVPYVQLEHIGAEADDHRLPLATVDTLRPAFNADVEPDLTARIDGQCPAAMLFRSRSKAVDRHHVTRGTMVICR